MTLDSTKPADSDFFSIWAYRERETRAYINALEASITLLGALATSSEVTMDGNITLTVGTQIDNVPVEVIFVTAVGSEQLDNIALGTQGQIKVFIMISGTMTFLHDAAKLVNNGSMDFDAATGDVIAYTNYGGNGSTTNGYWIELFRNIKS